jgi:hypothetical protein
MTRAFALGLAFMIFGQGLISGQIAHNGWSNTWDWIGPNDLGGVAQMTWLIGWMLCGAGGSLMVTGTRS